MLLIEMDCISCPAGLLCVTGTLMDVALCPACHRAMYCIVIDSRGNPNLKFHRIRVDAEDSVTQAVFHCCDEKRFERGPERLHIWIRDYPCSGCRETLLLRKPEVSSGL
jgi:hypothetical protein